MFKLVLLLSTALLQLSSLRAQENLLTLSIKHSPQEEAIVTKIYDISIVDSYVDQKSPLNSYIEVDMFLDIGIGGYTPCEKLSEYVTEVVYAEKPIAIEGKSTAKFNFNIFPSANLYRDGRIDLVPRGSLESLKLCTGIPLKTRISPTYWSRNQKEQVFYFYIASEHRLSVDAALVFNLSIENGWSYHAEGKLDSDPGLL